MGSCTGLLQYEQKYETVMKTLFGEARKREIKHAIARESEFHLNLFKAIIRGITGP